ncbi:MAG: T9SS type A sorting domain-containing protein [Chitinophagales bacterium]|nr:T9SS type A sorting domain-containing protein [Chitinophagales bacterium]
MSDIWVVKLNKRGNIEQSLTLGGSDYDEANCIQQTYDGGFVVCGGTSSTDGDIKKNRGLHDFWIVRLEPSVIDSADSADNKIIFRARKAESITENLLSIFPSITTGTFEINLQTSNTIHQVNIEIFNAFGQLVQSQLTTLTSGIIQTEITLDAALPRGLYFVKTRCAMRLVK